MRSFFRTGGFALLTCLLLQACNTQPSQAEQPPAGRSLEAAPTDSATARLFRDVMRYARAEQLHRRPLGEIMQAVGMRLQGKPYLAGMLDEPASETLICRLDGFDCVTFVESTLAMARGIAGEDYSYATFERNIRQTRYRGGVLDGYCSRLHYFSDWIRDNEARGSVRDVTEEIGGARFPKALTFITANRDKYPRLADAQTYACIREMEADLAGHTLYYVPKARVREVYARLKPGDIIATATSIAGLDVTHTGLAYKTASGKVGLLHASPSGGVKISEDLHAYLAGNKSQVGIFVARPLPEAPAQ